VTRLPDRDLELLALLADGLNRRQIADRLELSLGGASWRIARLYRRLGAYSREHALYLARAGRLLELRVERPRVVRVPLDPPEVIEARRRVLLGEEDA
jgi:DNA-binding CsgD family transcriptional regulator